MKQQLPFHEWFMVIAILGMMAVISIIAYGNSYREEKLLQKVPKIEVVVTGEVAYPGTYFYPPGVEIKKVLNQVRPTSDASLSQFVNSKHLYSSTTLNISKKREEPFLEGGEKKETLKHRRKILRK